MKMFIRMLLTLMMFLFFIPYGFAEGNGVWEVRESSDPITDESTVRIRNRSDQGTLVLVCHEGMFGIYVVAEAVVRERSGSYKQITYRFLSESGNRDALDDMWLVGRPDNSYLFAVGSVRYEILANMLTYDQFVWRADDYRGRTMTYIFDLDSLADVLHHLSCITKSDDEEDSDGEEQAED